MLHDTHTGYRCIASNKSGSVIREPDKLLLVSHIDGAVQVVNDTMMFGGLSKLIEFDYANELMELRIMFNLGRTYKLYCYSMTDAQGLYNAIMGAKKEVRRDRSNSGV